MRFLLIIKATEYLEAELANGKDYRDAMISYKRSLAKKGVLFADEKLQLSSNGIRITYPKDGGKPQVLTGSLPVNQDLITEYMVIDASTEDEALHWALSMPVPEAKGKYEIEIRRLKEKLESKKDPGLKALEDALQDHLTMLKKI
ncbi:YciI family protein [Ferdinandcohnia quinoae]|uniref:YciI family protein n=1 Tax=Fredinandcohnia quinoae TaxID=2918902 RepID=A0AAW5DZH8_9BACI|nr:YciI family protein [Fredinandcohnia sp. SECRCQ15]MCH1624425.1 YciI family protein [Fredinandcohnia sp. SECRCQ15]